MGDNETAHGRLVGLPFGELRKLAPTATHQHRKGGLYMDLGIPRDTETKEAFVDKEGRQRRAWLHVYPHDQAVYLRPISEDDKFRKLT